MNFLLNQETKEAFEIKSFSMSSTEDCSPADRPEVAWDIVYPDGRKGWVYGAKWGFSETLPRGYNQIENLPK